MDRTNDDVMNCKPFHSSTVFKTCVYLFLMGTVVMSPGLCHGHKATFVEGHLCADDSVLCPDSLSQQGNSISELECARLCQRDKECVGFSRPKQRDQALVQQEHPFPASRGISSCTLHYECLSRPNELCRNHNVSVEYMEKVLKQCENGGTWLEDKQKCDCPYADFWIGRYCSKAPRCCEDLFLWGYPRGVYHVTRQRVPPLIPKKMNCIILNATDQVNVSSIIYDYRLTPGEPVFNKSWLDFENGIYEGNTNFFIGLRHVKDFLDLTHDATPRLVVIFTFFTKETLAFLYEGVRLSSSLDGYRLTYSSVFSNYTNREPNGTQTLTFPVPQCLKSANNSRFSTFDQDFDNVDGINCAMRSGSGFWYNDSCRPLCNPFSRFNDSMDPEPFGNGPDENSTYIWGGKFRKVQMMITSTFRTTDNEEFP